MKVALLAEGVDRNSDYTAALNDCAGSPSSRRAWIEMMMRGMLLCRQQVALLAEGVDRNMSATLSATFCAVALLAEGVDRNRLPDRCR